ncbi:hypothetical protein BDF14DRAFT_1952186 [Spinellus fusiger]|nr:hypothetical protein BDF14DRAFT_1952186 [Spinellus fusiger]
MSVAVLGGGISGLSTAFYLSRSAPTTKIVVVEAGNRVGGWIRSQRVSPGTYFSIPTTLDSKEENVLLEVGPRSLRPVGPGGAVVLDMMSTLGLQEQVLSVDKSHASAKHRYIYYNGSVNTLPSSMKSLLLDAPPVMTSVIGSILREPWVASADWSAVEDESLYDFVHRRFNKHVALNLVGSITHGIYAGDVKALSVKSTLRLLYENERVYGSVVKGLLKGGADMNRGTDQRMTAEALQKDSQWISSMQTKSVIGFKEGTETLVHSLREWLQCQPNVEILTGESVERIDLEEGRDGCKVTTTHKILECEHIVSALPCHVLDRVMDTRLEHLVVPSVDVAVVNLVYNVSTPFPYNGFGFLTPHPDSNYKLPVPGTLGVVFDSNSMPDQDSHHALKLTVMLGGHQWNSTFGQRSIRQVKEEEVLDYARKAVGAYLNIHDAPSHSMTNLLESCIPQYTVGHESRLRALHRQVQAKGKLSLVGASYLGVSVPDCIKHSKEFVNNFLESRANGSVQSVTGLERVVTVPSGDVI